MKKLVLTATAVALASMGGAAHAGVTLSSQLGASPYTGPAPTYDWDSPATTPITSGGMVQTGNNAQGAQPLGSTGNYFTVGPNSSPAFLDLSGFAGIASLSFIWGSVDTYNDLYVIARDGTTVLAHFNGTAAAVPANGNQTAANTNPIVTLDFSGVDQGNIGGLRYTSTSEAFETDNYVITAVPEPATWALLILGFGLIGGALRSRTATRRHALTKFSYVS